MNKISLNRQSIIKKINDLNEKSTNKESFKTKLVAVSKNQAEYKIDQAIKSGQRIFGENRVQEAQIRWEEKRKYYKDLELRLIGPLQTNKVKQALNLFDIIETIDREKLAKQIYKNFHDLVRTKSFYIQINTGNEIQKSGISTSEADSFIKFCKNDLKLPIIGLMCIPPQNEEVAMHFCLLKKIANNHNLLELSMGMSDDFEEAIKFGATSVRIGSKFFGRRED